MEQNRFTGLRLLLAAACFVIVCAGLKAAQSILVPFLLAIFLTILGTPAVVKLMRLRVPKIIAVLIVALSMLAILVSLGIGFGSSVNKFTSELPRYSEKFSALYSELTASFAKFGVASSNFSLMETFSPASALDLFGKALRRFAATISTTILITILVIFMLFEAAEFRSKIQNALKKNGTTKNINDIAKDIQRYLGIKTITSMITGVAVGLLNLAVGVEFAILWGILAFLLNYIPFIGSIIASVPSIALTLLHFSYPTAIIVAIGYLVINIGISNFLEPILMGRRLGLSPLIVFGSLVFWGWLWGPVGMLLSVPLTMMVKILLEHSREFSWIALLMDNKVVR